MWFLPLLALAATPLPGPGMPLPQAIRATLDQEYPGWKLAPVTPAIQKEFSKRHLVRLPSLTAGDFNHDGKWDYAVQIALTTPGAEEQIVIVFLATGAGYEENIVQSMGLDPTAYLWVKNKVVTETGPDGQDKVANRDVLMVLGGPIGDTGYGYVDGKFQEIKLEEDPEHPDPTIPRPLRQVTP
jgi:hypothetical protein